MLTKKGRKFTEEHKKNLSDARCKGKNYLYRDKNWLIQKHNIEKLSIREMAKLAGCGFWTITYWMKVHDLPRAFLGVKKGGNHINISRRLNDMLVGELLGDGNLELRLYGQSARYNHANKHEQYLVWLFGLFEKEGLQWNGKITERKIHNVFYARTYSYREFSELYRKWYPNGKKIVPLDIDMSPTVLKHWYLGDGCLSVRKARGSYEICLSTQSFTKGDVTFLVDKLAGDAGIHATSNNKAGVIYITKQNAVMSFFQYIKGCNEEIEDIYGYKWIGGAKQNDC